MRIEDDLIKPYVIIVDGENFTLGIPKEYEKKDGTITTQMQNASYFYSFSDLLKKVIKIKIQENEGTIDLENFIKLYKKIWDEIDQKLNILK